MVLSLKFEQLDKAIPGLLTLTQSRTDCMHLDLHTVPTGPVLILRDCS